MEWILKVQKMIQKQSQTLISYKQIVGHGYKRVKTRTVKVDCNFLLGDMWLSKNAERKEVFYQLSKEQ